MWPEYRLVARGPIVTLYLSKPCEFGGLIERIDEIQPDFPVTTFDRRRQCDRFLVRGWRKTVGADAERKSFKREAGFRRRALWL